MLAGRRREPLDETAQAIGTLVVAPADVSDPASVEALFARNAFGRLDLLFNNAGSCSPACRSRTLRSSSGGASSTST